MGFIAVIVAAAAAFAVGAVWYGLLAEAWKKASQVPLGADGRPVNASDPKTYALAYLCTLIVTGMMRHAFAASGIDTIAEGVMAGFGIGAFFITPWYALNILFGARDKALIWIDGGYATVGCAVAGLVLTLF